MTTSPHPFSGSAVPPAAPRAALPEEAVPSMTEALCIRLGQRGWTARLEVVDVCGEPDARLRVTRPGSPVHVELLGPYRSPAQAPRWCAVRITPRQRTVWRGPHLGCSPQELLWFLEALAAHEVADPARQHYQALS